MRRIILSDLNTQDITKLGTQRASIESFEVIDFMLYLLCKSEKKSAIRIYYRDSRITHLSDKPRIMGCMINPYFQCFKLF